MRRVFLLLQLLCSAARRALSLSRAVLPFKLLRIITALKRFVGGCFTSLKSPGVSTSSGLPDSPSSTPQQRSQSIQAPDCCMPSSLPSELHAQQQDTPLPERSVVPETTLRTLPIPFAPNWFQRDKHRRLVEKTPNKEKIKAGQMSFSEDVPDHWERVVHPEGARYYFDARKNVFTDISLTELGDLAELDACIHFLREKEGQLLSSSTFRKYPTKLVIQLVDSEQWVYYFVNHESHVVFWVDDFDLAGTIRNIFGATEDSHIKYAIEEQYWLHCEHYPNSVPLLEEHITEVWGAVAFSYMDTITSIAPLCPLGQEELGKILDLMAYLQARTYAIDGHGVWILARVMRIIARGKFYNFYGQPGARLEADMSVYLQQGQRDESHIFFHFLDLVFCFALASYVQELRSIWVDDIVNHSRWRKFTSNLTIGWSSFTIYSTVMLAVDISLLAVPAVNQGDVNSQSVAVVATYMSLLCATGSLVSSVLLARQINTLTGVAEAATFMYKMSHWRGGTTILGVILSLPYALMIWAMFFFALALFYIIFQTTDPASLSVMILGTVLVTGVISLPTWWGRDHESLIKWLSDLKGRFQQRSSGEQESV
ncbi:hypothetical protein OG21DRAFT_1508125 [Imleria badia]|nr:hypothetical protein OG21DRAFT_1508125 [Imleria badia]